MNENSAGTIARALMEMVAKGGDQKDPGKEAGGLVKNAALKSKPVKEAEQKIADAATDKVKGAAKKVKDAAREPLGKTFRFMKKTQAQDGPAAAEPKAPAEMGEKNGPASPVNGAVKAARGAKKKARDAAIDAGVRMGDAKDAAIASAAKAGVKAAEVSADAMTLGVGAPITKAAAASASKGIDAVQKARSTTRHAMAEETKKAGDRADAAKEGAKAKPLGAQAMENLAKGNVTKGAAAIVTGKDVAKDVTKGLSIVRS